MILGLSIYFVCGLICFIPARLIGNQVINEVFVNDLLITKIIFWLWFMASAITFWPLGIAFFGLKVSTTLLKTDA